MLATAEDQEDPLGSGGWGGVELAVNRDERELTPREVLAFRR